MILWSICIRQMNIQRLINCRYLSYYYTKRQTLNTTLPIKYKMSTYYLPSRSISSVTSITFPSWFVALSNSTPVAYAQQFVISFHEFTGMPWWTSIMLSAITLRLIITLPLTVYQVGKIM